jgi:hypothetical protein
MTNLAKMLTVLDLTNARLVRTAEEIESQLGYGRASAYR